MIIYQDWEQLINESEKENFIIESIRNFKSSLFYSNALKSRSYYEGMNDIINRRRKYFDENFDERTDSFVANNRISNNFYAKILTQEKNYLMSNGVEVDREYKDNIKKLNERIGKLIHYFQLDGISYMLCNKDKHNKFKITPFSGIEFIPFYDERTSDLRAGIRFNQIAPNRPVYIELYEENGITEYKLVGSNITRITDKRPFTAKVLRDQLGERREGENWSELPIVEFNPTKINQNRLTYPLKSKIDLYDIIISDFGNNLEDALNVFWVLENAQGEDKADFLKELKYLGVISTDGESKATMHTQEIPYQARETALNMLKAKIYEEAMAVDMSIIVGGSITNEHIKAAFSDLDLKCDKLEEELKEVIDDILEFYLEYKNGIGIDVDEDFDISFNRNSLLNETQTIDNLVKQVSVGLLSKETALKWNPFVTNSTEELKLIEEEQSSIFKEGEIIEGV